MILELHSLWFLDSTTFISITLPEEQNTVEVPMLPRCKIPSANLVLNMQRYFVRFVKRCQDLASLTF